MANPYFEPGGQRAAKVSDLFGAIARRYDLVNDVQSFGLHRYWKRRLAALARVGPDAVALDLCCGTGDIALRIAKSGAAVVALDFSLPMLQIATARTSPGAAAPVWLIRGDALHIPLPDNSVDAVTISYGLRNLADVRAGLREMWRVAKPGGRLLVLDFGKPKSPAWRAVYFAYLRRVVPWFGRLLGGSADAYAYILESLEHYPAQEGVLALTRELPVTNARVVNFLGGVMSINYAEKL
jgi:demethylmenaquinone methyltransferase/2-methoxy-6-polyprenyl-1,4-benzoquinol methylase